MYLVIAKASCQPDAREDVIAALTTLCEASRQDEGCLAYDFYSSVEDPNTYRSVESWDTAENAGAHLGQPHVAAAIGALTPVLTSAIEIIQHEVAETTQLA